MRSLLLSCFTTALLSLPTLAHADTFSFSFSDPGTQVFINMEGVASAPTPWVNTGQGTFTANLVSPGVYTVTTVVGTVNGLTINESASGTFGGITSYDNLLYYSPNHAYFDGGGVNFFLPEDDGGSMTLFYADGIYQEQAGVIGGGDVSYKQYTQGPIAITDLTTATTPEPSSWLLLATGMLGSVCLLRRKSLQAN